MAEKPLRVGQLVELPEKNLIGKVAYVGTTQFATGKWIGVVLDEPKGKNNGSVQGKSYFTCPDNHGLFVRQTQLKVLSDADETEEPTAPEPVAERPASARPSSGIRPPSLQAQPTTPTTARSSTESAEETKTSPGVMSASAMPALGSGLPPLPSLAPTLIPTTQIKSFGRIPSATGGSPQSEKPGQAASSEEVEALKAQIKDREEMLETLKIKRAEDKAKLKEFEKAKIQIQQLLEHKRQMAEAHSDLQKQLALAKKEAKEAIEEKLQHSEDMKELEETAEMATLDKEMAEEKYEQAMKELESTKERLEEITVDYELLKTEIEEKGGDGVASSFQVKQLEQQNEKLKDAVIKLRDFSAHDKNELNRVAKELERSKTEATELQKTKEKLTAEVKQFEDQVIDLKEQVDLAMGAQEMVEILTDKNLQLEDEINQMREDKDVLEKLIETSEQLLESARETEQELLQEVDMGHARLSEMQLKLDTVTNALVDHKNTIDKFRQLVTQLRSENEQLREASDASVVQTQKQIELEKEHAIENEEFKIRFQEAKVEKAKLEMEHLMTAKKQAEESQTELQNQLMQVRNELKEAIDEKLRREVENSELKRALKIKIDEASEMCIRKDIAEKKLQNSGSEANERVARVQAELDQLKGHYKKKEKEFEETMNHLQTDIDALESERGELKDKVKVLSKKTIFEGLQKNLAAGAQAVGGSPTHSTSSQSLFMSEAGYVQQINTLRQALQMTADENYNLKMRAATEQLKLKPATKAPRFKPMWLLRAQGKNAEVDPVQAELTILLKKAQSVQRELRLASVGEKLYDLSRPIQAQVREEQLAKQQLLAKYHTIEREIADFVKIHSNSYLVSSDLNKFTASELRQYLDQRQTPSLVAKVAVPCAQEAKSVTLEVTLNQFRRIHQTLI